jgi:hypothetical protein
MYDVSTSLLAQPAHLGSLLRDVQMLSSICVCSYVLISMEERA